MTQNTREPGAEKRDIYRQYCTGEVAEAEVREVFGDEFGEFLGRREVLETMSKTPNKSPSEDLLC